MAAVLIAVVTKADPYGTVPTVIEEDDESWSVPQAVIFTVLTNGGFWALIVLAVRWLIDWLMY